MSTKITFDVDIKKFKEAMRKAKAKLMPELKDAMKEIATTATAEAKKITPRSGWPLSSYKTNYTPTGHLRGSVRYSLADNGLTIHLRAGSEAVPYAVYVHEGTRYMPPRPFLKQAFLNNIDIFEKRIGQALDNALGL
jgi:HK97 gp10 family phage protein